jgi:cytidylate kinase
MIITIDGPAGTGKSTVAQAVAERLGFDFLDTGAMYRAVALAALRKQVALDDSNGLGALAESLQIRFDWKRRPPELLLDGEAVSALLRGAETTRAASKVAAIPAVRHKLVAEQRQIAREHGRLVTEGRDQGSAVFPDAALKIYLRATPRERARRRVQQLAQRGEIVDLNIVLSEITERDARDASRSVGPLTVPQGAVEIDTTSITQDQVIEKIVELAKKGPAGGIAQ